MVNFLVVLYGKGFEESTTLQSLSQYMPLIKGCQITVWNNGPESLQEKIKDSKYLKILENKGVNVVFQESLENKSLSVIYNTVWKECTGILSILDDDTLLNPMYFSSLQAFSVSESMVMVPQISCQGCIVYPKIKGKNIETIFNQLVKDSIVSVMSGVCVKDTLKPYLFDKYTDLFDERFCFYGVDSVFFKRLKNIGYRLFFIASPLEHSLSSMNITEISDFRVKERIIDSCLQMRNYPCLGSFKGFFLTLSEFGLKRAIAERHSVFISLYYGIHPRLK